MAGMQSMKNPNMIQMQRDGSNMDMNGNRPNSPGSNENAPSPNKRPRVEGTSSVTPTTRAQANQDRPTGGMNAGNMPNNQFNEFMPQGPGAQQKNIEVYAQSLAHQHRVAMSNTSSPRVSTLASKALQWPSPASTVKTSPSLATARGPAACPPILQAHPSRATMRCRTTRCNSCCLSSRTRSGYSWLGKSKTTNLDILSKASLALQALALPCRRKVAELVAHRLTLPTK